MVVNRRNVGEVFEMIEYCRQLGCDLKLLDVVSVPRPHVAYEDMHCAMDQVESELENASDEACLHEYARGFGTPCRIYEVGGVRVTVKRADHGSRYDMDGICRDCAYYPCHEGLYDIFVLPDGRACGCRWSPTSVAPTQDAETALRWLQEVFQRAEWSRAGRVSAMKRLEDLF